MSGSERAAALPQWTRAAATWRDALLVTWAVARRDRFALAGLIIYAVLLAVALAAPALAPYNPLDLNYRPERHVAADRVVRGSRPGAGGQPRPHDVRAHRAQRASTVLPVWLAGRGVGDSDRGQHQLSGIRRSQRHLVGIHAAGCL